MSLSKRGKTVNTQSIVDGKIKPAFMGQGMDSRVRSGLYPEMAASGRSVHNQSAVVTTTERIFGNPSGSGQDIYTRLTGTTGVGLQISSTSVNDTAAGTGAQTIYIEGIKISNSGNTWTDFSTFSTPTSLNGQDPVQIGSDTDWYRINKIWVLTSGSGNKNDGDLYISPANTLLTAGVPDENVLQAMNSGYSVSSGGFFSVASNRQFQFIIGNFYVDESKAVIIHECFFQDFNGSGNTADMTQYEVGQYPLGSQSYDYTGAAPYTEKTDIYLGVHTDGGGGANNVCYYVEYVPIVASESNR